MLFSFCIEKTICVSAKIRKNGNMTKFLKYVLNMFLKRWQKLNFNK